MSAKPSWRRRLSDSRARNRMRSSLNFMGAFRSERKTLALGNFLPDQVAQTGDVDPRMFARFVLGHAVGFFVDLAFLLEVGRHELDHAGDQRFDIGFWYNRAGRLHAFHEMARQSVDFLFPDRHLR